MEDKRNPANVQIKQIAELLGVSSGTVSVVLNGRGDQMRISKETQKRVQDIAREMNYQPNIYARRLRKSAKEELPYIIAVFWRAEYLDDLLGKFFQGLYQTVKQNYYNVELILQPYDFGKLGKHRDSISSERFNGAIFGGIADEDQSFLEQNDFDIPIVLIGRNTEKYNSVIIDDYGTGASCARLFFSRKHKVVGLLGMEQRGKSVQIIEKAFLETCKEKKIRIDENSIYYCKNRDFSSGYEATMKLLSNKEKPTALFVMDARNAGGVFNACRTIGLNIPEDIEVLVFGDIEYFSYSNPTITSIHQPIQKFAESSLNMIMELMKKKVDMPMVQEYATIFNFRESCGGYLESEKSLVTISGERNR